MAKRKSKQPEPETPAPQPAGFQAPPADGGLSIDKLAQAFAAMMGTGDPYAQTDAEADVVKVDASPVLDDDDSFTSGSDDVGCRVCPETILEAILFVGPARRRADHEPQGGRPDARRAATGDR